MMNKEQMILAIHERLERLQTVLYFHSEVGVGNLTVFERICINQERGSLYDHLNHINGELHELDVRNYQVPEHIENKIKFIETKIY